MVSWWVMNVWEQNPAMLVSWVVWVIVSITLHELGHGWMAMQRGDETPAALGHMTFNPFVHIPWPWAWVMFAAFGFTWGLMPVNPSRFRGRYDESLVAFAGPAVNLILAVLCLGLDVVWLTNMTHVGDPVHGRVHTFLWAGTCINLMGFMFNLIPIPPLDGSRILADIYPVLNRTLYRTEWLMLVATICMFKFGYIMWGLVYSVARWAMDAGLMGTGGDWRNPWEPV